jgi:murein DD-endopeptidase MepM/ murein hydrolase activator NlpD
MKQHHPAIRKIIFALKLVCVYLQAFLIAVCKVLIAKRTVLFMTKSKIRSVTFGPFSQLLILLFLFWVGDIFVQSLQYDKIIGSKADEIARLKSLNGYFEEEFSSVQEKLSKVNTYLISITGGSKQDVKYEATVEDQIEVPSKIKGKDTQKEDKHTFNQIKEINDQINRIRSIARSRVKKIENAVSIAGLNIKRHESKTLSQKEIDAINSQAVDQTADYSGQGGPLEEEAMMNSPFNHEELLERQLSKKNFNSEIDYMIVLEKLARVAPFAKPMKNYYISSGFGARVDPLTHHGAVHKGLDFVGVSKEKIISPSEGKVILAKRFSSYGNAIVIDHGFGITTRYGHLDSIKVEEGQMVKKGEVIAIQGNTGRSTGAHLHYEVRYKNIPLNPRKFLEAGNFLNNDKDNSNFIRS